MIRYLLLSFTLFASAYAYAQDFLNERPIIGILSKPFDSKDSANYTTNYIATSYVKFYEGAGARVVPIHWDLPKEELKKVFDSVNGIAFPGGDLWLLSGEDYTAYTLAGKYLYDLVIEANANGDYFPLSAVCLGYEMLTLIISEDPNIFVPLHDK